MVVASEHVQADLRNQMLAFWQSIGLPDTPQALDWGNEVPEDWRQVAGWHQDVLSSSSIKPLTDDKRREVEASFAKLKSENGRFQAILDHHMPFYERLRAHALPWPNTKALPCCCAWPSRWEKSA